MSHPRIVVALGIAIASVAAIATFAYLTQDRTFEGTLVKRDCTQGGIGCNTSSLKTPERTYTLTLTAPTVETSPCLQDGLPVKIVGKLHKADESDSRPTIEVSGVSC